ncbi:hypothetical protein Tco_0887598 [Tanacetum coccineum]
MMVSGLDANASSVADIRKGRVGSEHYGPENIQDIHLRSQDSIKADVAKAETNNANLINSLDDSSSKEFEYFDEEQVVLWRPLLPPSI